jgi:hypothetical protein
MVAWIEVVVVVGVVVVSSSVAWMTLLICFYLVIYQNKMRPIYKNNVII